VPVAVFAAGAAELGHDEDHGPLAVFADVLHEGCEALAQAAEHKGDPTVLVTLVDVVIPAVPIRGGHLHRFTRLDDPGDPLELGAESILRVWGSALAHPGLDLLVSTQGLDRHLSGTDNRVLPVLGPLAPAHLVWSALARIGLHPGLLAILVEFVEEIEELSCVRAAAALTRHGQHGVVSPERSWQ